jgi:hypothetical protein
MIYGGWHVKKASRTKFGNYNYVQLKRIGRQKRKENIRTGCYQFILYVHCASVFVQDRLKKDESKCSHGDRNVEKGLAENAKAFRKNNNKKKIYKWK